MVTQASGGSIALINGRLRRNLPDALPATALLVRDGVVAAVGTDDEIRSLASTDMRVVDLDGATVTPGLWDSHAHPDSGALSARGLDLAGVASIDELRRVLAERAAELAPGEWLEAWNVEYEMFENTGIDRKVFEDLVPDLPVLLLFYDGHTGLASSAALAAAGVREPIRFPDGSETVVDGDGRLTGELKEMTVLRLLTDAIPRDSEQELAGLEEVFRRFAASGLTGCAVMDGNTRTRELLAALEEAGRLTQRVVVHEWHKVHFDDGDQDRIIAAKDERGRLWEGGAVKLFSDGVIDTGTALLHEPDSHGEGRLAAWPDWDEFKRVVRRYHDAGMLMAIHAVGDRAVNDVLDAYAELPEMEGRRWSHSIEHLEVTSDPDIEKLGGSGVVASMQPLHMQWRKGDFSDNWAQRLGSERRSTGYRCQSILASGARIVLGSDWPVADFDPRIGMAWARGRTTPGATDDSPFEPEERLTGEQALLAYTLWPALARGHQDRGHLSKGAVGDITVFEVDPVTARVEDLPNIRVRMTIVDGRVVHEAP